MKTGHLYYTDEAGVKKHLGLLQSPKGESKRALKNRLMDEFWDPRLDSAGCSPVVEIW